MTPLSKKLKEAGGSEGGRGVVKPDSNLQPLLKKNGKEARD
jgi:hypothetical protein